MTVQATETLTNAMIRELRDDAGNAGDCGLVEICDDALCYEPNHPEWSRDYWLAARRDCANAINEARGMCDEPQPHVVVED